MVGHNPHSLIRMPSGLLRTWDYFYSSGGWDDYPPQHELRSRTELYPSVAPMVTTSYYLRAAKILRACRPEMGLRRDVAQYDRDIRMLTDAIQRNAWDDEAGYFGYVMHDTAGRPVSLFRYQDGSNFNKGLDGVSPFVAGICTPRQTGAFWKTSFRPTGCGPTWAFRPSTVRPLLQRGRLLERRCLDAPPVPYLEIAPRQRPDRQKPTR